MHVRSVECWRFLCCLPREDIWGVAKGFLPKWRVATHACVPRILRRRTYCRLSQQDWSKQQVARDKLRTCPNDFTFAERCFISLMGLMLLRCKYTITNRATRYAMINNEGGVSIISRQANKFAVAKTRRKLCNACPKPHVQVDGTHASSCAHLGCNFVKLRRAMSHAALSPTIHTQSCV